MLWSEQYFKHSLYLQCFFVHKMAIIAGRQDHKDCCVSKQLQEPQVLWVPVWLLCLSLRVYFRSVLDLVRSRFPCEMWVGLLMCPCAWGALNTTKTSVSRHTQDVKHQWAWGGCRREGWQCAGGVTAWLCGHQGSGRAGSTLCPAAVGIYNVLPSCLPDIYTLLSPCRSRMRA